MRINRREDFKKLKTKNESAPIKRMPKKNKTVKEVLTKASQLLLQDSRLTSDLIDYTDVINEMNEDGYGPVLTKAGTKVAKNQLIKAFLEENQLELLKSNMSQLPKIKTEKGGQSVVVVLSDWHFGKIILDENKKIVFNSAIAKERIEKELVAQLIQKLRALDPSKAVDEIVLIMAGDIVDNDIIYDTQRFHVDSGVAVQFNNVVNCIIYMLRSIGAECKLRFKKEIPVRIEGISGNHGRASSHSEIGECSWDTAVYAAVKMVVANSPVLAKFVRVNFTIADHLMIDVRGHRGLITHGGPPQAETASAKRKFGGLYEIFNYDFSVYGHRHHWGIATYNGRPLFMNASLCGADDYALKLAVRDNWSQLMFTVTDTTIGRQIMRIEEEA